MDKLNASHLNARNYPKNLISTEEDEYLLEDTKNRLLSESTRIFCDFTKAGIFIVEKDEGDAAFITEKVASQDQLEKQLRICDRNNRKDPISRYIFFHAPNARARLNVTRPMYTTALSYHQVMPGFVDFLYAFGHQEESEDFHYGGFKTDCRLRESSRVNAVQELGRSGRFYQMCFNLRSVEASTGSPEWPFTIRQNASYHSFDVENGRTAWIMIKANKLIRNRIEETAKSPRTTELRDFSTASTSLNASLKTLKILCDWSREGWHQYIKFLEKEFRHNTRQANLANPEKSATKGGIRPGTERSNTIPSLPTRRWTLVPSRKGLESFRRTLTSTFSGVRGGLQNAVELANVPISASDELPEDPRFAFQNLTFLQFLEEKCHEASLVIKTDVKNLEELVEFYDMLMQHKDFPVCIRTGSADAFSSFKNHITGAISDLGMQLSRLETLVRLLVDRRSFLQSILDHRNMLTNLYLSEKAQQSANRTEVMTERLEKIAIKTEEETIFMRIITVVTLLFLPPTFVSTIMSTDIIRFNPQKTFISDALSTYVTITIPLTVLTFVFAAIFRWYETRRLGRAPKVGGE